MVWEMTTELTLMSSFNKSLGHWEHRFTTFLHVLVVLIICVQRLFHLWLLPHTWEMVENWGRNLELFGVTHLSRGFSSGLYGKESVCIQETRVQSLGREDPLEEGMAIHSSILAWRIPWTEEPSRPQSWGSQRVGHDWVTDILSIQGPNTSE